MMSVKEAKDVAHENSDKSGVIAGGASPEPIKLQQQGFSIAPGSRISVMSSHRPSMAPSAQSTHPSMRSYPSYASVMVPAMMPMPTQTQHPTNVSHPDEMTSPSQQGRKSTILTITHEAMEPSSQKSKCNLPPQQVDFHWKIIIGFLAFLVLLTSVTLAIYFGTKTEERPESYTEIITGRPHTEGPGKTTESPDDDGENSLEL